MPSLETYLDSNEEHGQVTRRLFAELVLLAQNVPREGDQVRLGGFQLGDARLLALFQRVERLLNRVRGGHLCALIWVF